MGTVSHKHERYESEWSKCGSGGVGVGEKGKRVHVLCES